MHKTGKKEIKVSLFIDDIIVYIENSKRYIFKKKTTLLGLENEFSEVSWYKISTKNLIAFLCINNEQNGDQN